MTTMTSSEARAALPEILDRVLRGEEVTITRHGQPVAVVLRPDALRSRRAGEAFAAADELADLLRTARSIPLDDAPPLTEERADERVAEIHAERSAR